MKTKKSINNQEEDKIRLNRYVANCGVCSRREADKIIAEGLVKVNGKVIREMGYKVSISDTVEYQGKEIKREKFVYILLNKPKGFVTTTKDPHATKTVMDLVANASKERIYPVGRLDKETTGLLLFTNNGELTQKLTHPSNNVKKIYKVSLHKPITKNHMSDLVQGIELEDGVASLDEIQFLDDSKKELGVEIHSGKNRIIRRMFDHLGYHVRKLDRVVFAGLTKVDLPRGKWRELKTTELKLINSFKKKQK